MLICRAVVKLFTIKLLCYLPGGKEIEEALVPEYWGKDLAAALVGASLSIVLCYFQTDLDCHPKNRTVTMNSNVSIFYK